MHRVLTRPSNRQLQRRSRLPIMQVFGRREALGLKHKPKAQAVTIPSVAQLEQDSHRACSAKE